MFIIIASTESSDGGAVGVVVGTVAAVFITGLTITVICVILLLQWRKRR